MTDVTKQLKDLAAAEKAVDERLRKALQDSQQRKHVAVDPRLYGRDRRAAPGRTR